MPSIRRRGPCRHCQKECCLFPRDLCNDHYRDRAIRNMYPTKRPFKVWTAREVRDLEALFKSGLTSKEAAATIGRSAKSVQAMRHREGLGKYKRIDPKRDAAIVKWLGKGFGVVEVGRRAGCCHTCVREVAKRFGITTRNTRSEAQARLRKNEFKQDGIWRFHLVREMDRLAMARSGWPVDCTSAQAVFMQAVIDGATRIPQIAARIGKTQYACRIMAYKLVGLGWMKKESIPGKHPKWHINWDHLDWNNRPIRLKHGPTEEGEHD